MVQMYLRIKTTAQIMFCVFALGAMALAQVTNATLTGEVTDPTGAAVPGARITTKNVSTNATETVVANKSGVYTAAQLMPGTYTVTTEIQGFQKDIERNVLLSVGQNATLNISLKLGSVSQSVTVTAASALLNTTTAEISQAVGERTIMQLPLNGRNPASLVLLTTGTTNVLDTGGGVLQGSNAMPDETGASANGGRQGSTYYLLDGAPNMDTYLLLAAPFPNADATREFRVMTNNFDVRYGFSPGAVVSIETKSGTNSFHGGLFEFIRNNAFNAKNYFSGYVDPLLRNQFGGDIGGPIIKNKLFFFANYQGTLESTTASTNTTYTPTQAMLNGDFSAVPITLKAPFATVNGKPNQINPALFSPAAVTIATTALPLGQAPATGLTNYILPGQTDHYTENTDRLDYNTNKQHLFIRSFMQFYTQTGGAVDGNLLAIVPEEPDTYYNGAFGDNWMINNSTVNNLTVFWNQLYASDSGVAKDTSGKDVCMSRYINVHEIPGQCYIEGFTVSNGFSSNWYEPTAQIRTTYGLSDTLTKTIHSHTISVGIDLQKQFSQETSQYPATPIIGFTNAWTGFGLADYLMGDVNEYMQGAGEIASVKGWQLGLYVQDQYRILPNLTLTAGLRWDPNLPPASTAGRGSAFHPGQQSTRFPNAPLGEVFAGDTGVDSAYMPTTYGYYEPRIGIAWQPKPRTSVRSAFGLFTGPLQYSYYNHLADISPFSPTFEIYSNAATDQRVSFDNPWATFPGGDQFPPFASLSYKPPTNAAFQTPVSLQATFSNNFKLPMTESWNLSVEQQLSQNTSLSVAYIGSETYHSNLNIDRNPGYNNVRSTYPQFGTILTDESIGTSPYNSFQASYQMRNFHGLTFNSNFTWSKVIDEAPSGNISFGGSLGDPYPSQLGWNRGISSLNRPFIFVNSFVYETPALNGSSRALRAVLGTWEVTGIYTMQSGSPFGIAGGNGNNNSGALQYGDRADVTGAPANPHSGSRSHWLNQYINPAAFKPNAVGTFGDSGANIFTSPYINTADIGVDKNWIFSGRYTTQFRWEMFNAFNHTSFGTPVNDPTASNFGQITGIGPIPPRVMQLAIKFLF